MGANIERPMFIDLVPVKKKKGRRRRRRRRRRDEDEEARKKKTHNIYARAFFSSPMSIFVNDRTAHLPSRALINCMYAQYLCRWQWYTCCLYMRRTCWLVKKSIANAIVKRNSLSLLLSPLSSFCLHLQSVAIANNCDSVTLLLCSCQYYQQHSDAKAIRIWILEDFFVRFSHSLSRNTFFLHIYAISKEQHSRLFLHYTPSNYQHQFKQKKKCNACKERNSLFMLSIAHNTRTHIHTQSIFRDLPSRQCCFWKAYRQLNELVNKKEEEREWQSKSIFWRRCEQMVVIMKNEWRCIYPRSNRYIILRTDGRYVQ